jgi:hypothetical protein
MQESSTLESSSPPLPEPMLPPPPPALDPRPSQRQTAFLLGAFVVGALLILFGLVVDFRFDRVLQHAGFFLATYALVVGASWLPPSVLSQRVDRILDKWVRSSTGGYYGVMALAMFAYLELHATLDGLAGFEFPTRGLIQFLVQSVVGASVQAGMNLGQAMGWPWPLISHAGFPAAPIFVGLTWGVFRLGSTFLPHASMQGPPRQPKKSRRRRRSGTSAEAE